MGHEELRQLFLLLIRWSNLAFRHARAAKRGQTHAYS